MWWTKVSGQRQAERSEAQDLAGQVLALEDNAVRAGCALVCSYSSSQEYEAALITERRAAGAYGPSRKAWPAHIAGIAAGITVIAALVFIFR
jgi:hypothetical protein